MFESAKLSSYVHTARPAHLKAETWRRPPCWHTTPKKAAAPAKKSSGEGVRFWAPGFGAGPLPNDGQIFYSEWSLVKQLFSMELIGGAQGDVREPGGREPFFGGIGLP